MPANSPTRHNRPRSVPELRYYAPMVLRRSGKSVVWVLALLVGCSGGDKTNASGSAAASSAAAPSTSSVAANPPTTSASGVAVEPGPAVSGTAIPSPSVALTGSAKPITSANMPPFPIPVNSGVASSMPQPIPVPTDPPDQLPPPESGSADAVAADIDALFMPLKRYKAVFLQKYKLKVQGTEKDSSGWVYVERPNKISFHYDAPNMNRIVSDGSMLDVYVADDQQMFQSPVKNTEYPGALAFIMGGGIRPSFTFKFNEKIAYDKGPVLVGTPRVPTPSYDSVLFYIDKDKLAKKDLGAVAGVLIVDAQGNRNRFEFKDAEQPASINAGEFSFTPPPGTDIKH